MIRYKEDVTSFMNELIDILYEKEYFGIKDKSIDFVSDLYDKIEDAILNNKIIRPAPKYFKKYGKNLKYVFFNTTKRTTWYVFFQKANDGRYLVCYITNNHVKGQYIRGLKYKNK